MVMRVLALLAIVVGWSCLMSTAPLRCQEREPEITLSLYENPIRSTREAVINARHTVYAVVFKFNEPTLLDALRQALARGVTVKLVVDSVDADRNKSLVREAERLGAEVRRWGSGELHAKFAIVDDVWVITGSFNWTRSAATSNVELVAGIGDAAVVARFVELFEDLWDRAGSPRR
jgi:phosphatidylserine/phosphatidylglycerophosphate/cardiolipin synthase-like enzyme